MAMIGSVYFYAIKKSLTLELFPSSVTNFLLWFELTLLQKSHRLVSKKSLLCIEGPARCGNSAALRLVTNSNEKYRQKIGTHIHHPIQIRKAEKFKTPYLVLLRDPAKSSVSHAALLVQKKQVTVKTQFEKALLLKSCIKQYIAFVKQIKDPSVIIEFDEFIQSPGIITDLLLRKFGTKVEVSEFRDISSAGIHVFPSDIRNDIKSMFEKILNDSEELEKLVNEASNLFVELTK